MVDFLSACAVQFAQMFRSCMLPLQLVIPNMIVIPMMCFFYFKMWVSMLKSWKEYIIRNHHSIWKLQEKKQRHETPTVCSLKFPRNYSKTIFVIVKREASWIIQFSRVWSALVQTFSTMKTSNCIRLLLLNADYVWSSWLYLKRHVSSTRWVFNKFFL